MGSTWSQRSFAAGEISPKLWARCDQSRYATSLKTCRNFQVCREGGVENRPGTQFIGECNRSRTTNTGVRVIPFVFSLNVTYMLEFGHQYMRVWKQGAQVLEAATTISGITQANPCVVTDNGHGYSNGDEIVISGVVGMTQVNGRNFKVSNVTTNTYRLNDFGPVPINSTAYSAYVSGGQARRVYTVATAYAASDLPSIQLVQSFDVLTLAHPSYPPATLSRSGDANWTFTVITFAPGIGPPIHFGGVSAGTTTFYAVTTISASGEESLPATKGTSEVPSSGSPVTLTWDPVVGAYQYYVYKYYQGQYALLGIVGSGLTFTGGTQSGFFDNGSITPDGTINPPTGANPFYGGLSANFYPSAVTYFQQRLMFANSVTYPQTVWGSQVGNFYNFTSRSPILDSDTVQFAMATRQSSPVMHLLDLGNLIVFTQTAESQLEGNAAGALTPTSINPTAHSYNGSTYLAPLVIDERAIYVQARGNYVRDLGFDILIEGYRGNDLSIFSTHLFNSYVLLDWTYQKAPHSIVWAVRSDGTLLGMTYLKEQQLVAWHRHDTLGDFFNVASVPEASEDAVYVVVNRSINGTVRTYIERFTSRLTADRGDVIDSIFMDSTLSFGGGAISGTMTLSGGTTWAFGEELTLTCSGAFFTAGMVNDGMQLTGPDGTLIRFTIDAYVSSTVVTGRPNKTVPASMRNVAVSLWAHAVATVGNLWSLEGQAVSVLADGFVVSSPNNTKLPVLTVQNGQLTLPMPFARIHVGLPYISDLETLDIDTPQGVTMADKKKFVGRVSAYLFNSRGLWNGLVAPAAGADPLDGLTELKIRDQENYDEPISLHTGVVETVAQGQWTKEGHVFLRQVDPLPLTILAVYPGGDYPEMRG